MRAEVHTATVASPLAPYVRSLTGYRLTGFPSGVHIGVPSTSLTLVIPLDAPLPVGFAGRSPTPIQGYAACLAGLHTRPAHVLHDGNQYGVQLDLSPGAAAAFFGCPASALAETAVDLAELPWPGPDLAARLRELPADAWDARFRMLQEALLERLRVSTAPPELGRAWHLILASSGRVRVADIARDVGWSARHLSGRFRDRYGVTPKAAARLARFEVASSDVRRGRPLAEVAADRGYADQAHLSRDFVDFTGMPATAWLADSLLVARSDSSTTSSDSSKK